MFVATYPPSISATAKLRYLEALKKAAERASSKAGIVVSTGGGHLRPSCHIVPESLAACYAIAHPEQGIFQAEPDGPHIDRLVFFDFGAGTVDVSAVELVPPKALENEGSRHSGETIGPYILSQTVCFSVPMGGNVLDDALLRDFQKLFPHRFNPSAAPGSIEWQRYVDGIESAKRNLKRCGSNRYLTIRLDDGSFTVDLEEHKGEMLNFETYARAVVDLIVTPTLKNCGPSDPGYARSHVVLAGRASLFPLLRERILDGAKGILATADLSMKIPPDEMKQIVAKGAIYWAQAEFGARLDEYLPRPAYVEANFAFVRGALDQDGFTHIERILDISELEPYPHEGPLYLAMRPPRLSEETAGKWLAEESGFARSMLHRCLRPLYLKGENGRASSPYRLGPDWKQSDFMVADRNARVSITVAHELTEIVLRVKAGPAGSEAESPIRLSGTFAI